MTRKYIWWLAAFTLFPIAVFAVAELNKSYLIWRIRIVDFCDLTLLGPFYAIALFVFYQIITESIDKKPDLRNTSILVKFALFFLACLFFEGHGMHMATNAVSTYIAEVHNYKPLIPPDAWELLFFLDEFLGHLLVFTALYTMLIIYALVQQKVPMHKISALSFVIISILGVIWGGAQMVAMIEASLPKLMLLYTSVSLLVNIVLFLRSKEQLFPYLAQRPLILFIASGLSAILLLTPVYYTILGGFLQPSQIGR